MGAGGGGVDGGGGGGDDGEGVSGGYICVIGRSTGFVVKFKSLLSLFITVT